MSDLIDGLAYTIKLAYRDGPPARENTEANRQKLVDALDRLVGGDQDALWNLFAPDVSFHEADCLPYGGSHYGFEASRNAHSQVYELFEEIHIVVEEVMARGDLAVVYATMDYRVRKNGRTGSFTLCETYRFRDGMVTEWRIHYFDAYKVAEALAAD